MAIKPTTSTSSGISGGYSYSDYLKTPEYISWGSSQANTLDPFEELAESLNTFRSYNTRRGESPVPDHSPKKEEADYDWREHYASVSRGTKKSPKKKNYLDQIVSLKDQYNLEECLKVYKELFEKQFGEIYLSGSVALKLQGIIERNHFRDVDIMVIGQFELDDDIINYRNQDRYPKNDLIISETKSVVYDNTPVDMFILPSDYKVNCVEVDYNGEVFLCQDYKDILKAKLNMILPNMKDYKDIVGKHLVVDFK